MAIKFTYRNFPDILPFNPFLNSYLLENMKDNGLGKIFNVQAYELETASNLEVFVTGIINRSVIGEYTITFSVINHNNETITEDKIINVVGGSKFFDSIELKIIDRVNIDIYTVTDISSLFSDMIFDNEQSVSDYCLNLLNRFTFYDTQGYKTTGCWYLSDGYGGNHLVDLTYRIYQSSIDGFYVSFEFENLGGREIVATAFFKSRNIDTSIYTKAEINQKLSVIENKISLLEESLTTTEQNNNTKIDETQFTELKSLLQGIAKVFMGVR